MPAQPRRSALENAIRLALVGSTAFALTLGPLDDPHAATLAIFGSFAFLLFADFGGDRGERLRDYLALALVGAVLIALGTACSRDPWLATAAMGVVGFAVLFSGVLGGTFAAGSSAALLALVLSLSIPAPLSVLPSRLLGWGIAAAFAIPALLLLWPMRPRDRLRAAAAAACHAFAELVAARGERDPALFVERREAALAAALAARSSYFATPYRPTGATGRAAALAALIDDLDWLGQFAARAPACTDDRRRMAFPTQSAELEAAVAQLLGAAAARLDGGAAAPDFARLARARAALGAALLDTIATAPAGAEERVELALEQAFALRMLSYSAWHLAADALRACGERVADVDEVDAGTGGRASAARSAVAASGRLAAAYASTRSVWFRNSLRGAIGLALAVGIGQAADLQHAFWAVLAMVSVLRSRAVSTGSSLLQALLGTLAGIVAGGLLVTVIGDHDALLWIALPFALLLAAYAPRAISFTAGQAAFSLAVLVIFNLIEPVGWQVGLVRIEDIAIGGAISLGVGLLLWPRGAVAVLRSSLARAYVSSAAVLSATVEQRLGGGTDGAALAGAAAREAADADAALARAVTVAVADARRLDDALRQCLSEPGGAQRERFAELSRLVAGSGRVRRMAHSLRSGHVLLPLDPRDTAEGTLAERRLLLERELRELLAWLDALAEAIARKSDPPAPQAGADAPDDTAAGVRLLRSEDDAPLAATATLAWSREHLVALRRLEPHLAEAAGRLTHPTPTEPPVATDR